MRSVSLASRVTMTYELFSADPRVELADLARGSAFSQTYSCLPEGRSRDPRVLPAGPPLSRRYSELRAHIRACRTIIPGISDEAYIIWRTPGRMKVVVKLYSWSHPPSLTKQSRPHTHPPYAGCNNKTIIITPINSKQNLNPCTSTYTRNACEV